MHLFVVMYKASVEKTPSDLKYNYKDLLMCEEFYYSIQCLSFYAEAPIFPKRDWADYIKEEISSISQSLEKIIDKYTFVLDGRIIEDIEWMSESFTFKILSIGSLFKNRKDYVLENKDTVTEIKSNMKRYFVDLDYFEKYAEDNGKGLKYDGTIWRDNIAPKIASGRIAHP